MNAVSRGPFIRWTTCFTCWHIGHEDDIVLLDSLQLCFFDAFDMSDPSRYYSFERFAQQGPVAKLVMPNTAHSFQT
jgi:hypothetical protein